MPIMTEKRRAGRRRSRFSVQCALVVVAGNQNRRDKALKLGPWKFLWFEESAAKLSAALSSNNTKSERTLKFSSNWSLV